MPSPLLRRSSLALTLVLVPPISLLGGCADEDADGYCGSQANWPAERVAFEDEVLEIVNQRRSEGANCGGQDFGPADPLTANAELRCAARVHSADMAIRDFFDHTNPDGESFVDRVNQTDYMGSPAGENIAFGYGSPEAVMAGWMDSPGHCSNIMNPSHTEIGVGFYDGNYWTQVMGRE